MTSEKEKKLKKRSVDESDTLLFCFRLMDELDQKLLVVFSDGEYRGLLSAGDIQRAIIKGVSLDSAVKNSARKNIRVASTNDDEAAVKRLMLDFRTELMPVVDEEGALVDVIFWNELFEGTVDRAPKINVPVVIMAGGKGTRLKPFSNILPKPLFPLGEKTILESIMESFFDSGCNRFLLSLNYKAEFIKNYLSQVETGNYEVTFFQEEKPLGTAGSLHLVADKISETFFISNCDIIIDCDYGEILDYHSSNKNEITLVAALKHTKIPYGTVTIGGDGLLKDFSEKPENNYLINTGMYLLEPHLLDEIPVNEFFHITELIDNVKKREGRVGVFPVSEKSWCDIGEWSEYGRTMKILGV